MASYDAFSSDYDRFVNWEARLAVELPFIEKQLQGLGENNISAPVRVLDAACGTGMHAIALAKQGYQTAGADLSAGMVERARVNAETNGVQVAFRTAGFGELAQAFAGSELEPFDAVLCLGNSLPHVLSRQDLIAALHDFAACLRPNGLALVQMRNFDAVVAQRARWMEPQSYQRGNQEWLFLRFYDYLSGPASAQELIDFNIVTLFREGQGAWTQQVTTTRLWGLQQAELNEALGEAGFGKMELYGDMAGSPYHPGTSGNLVVVARKPGLAG